MDGPSRRPAEQCRSEGTPSHSEAPTGGAEPFAYFGLGRHSGFSKVSRCKSETISGRYLNNGYAPDQTQKKRPHLMAVFHYTSTLRCASHAHSPATARTPHTAPQSPPT